MDRAPSDTQRLRVALERIRRRLMIGLDSGELDVHVRLALDYIDGAEELVPND